MGLLDDNNDFENFDDLDTLDEFDDEDIPMDEDEDEDEIPMDEDEDIDIDDDESVGNIYDYEESTEESFDSDDDFDIDDSDTVDSIDVYKDNENDDSSSYEDGSIIEDENDLPLGLAPTMDPESDIISDTGDIVVMVNDEDDNFELKYVDINDIAIVTRIRQNKNVDELVRSIKSTGLIQPIVVAPTATDGIYVLLDGYRRILACAKCGKRSIPCVINTKVKTPEIPILEALYNHSKSYNISEMVDYIDYLEKQKGIMSASMIEYLLQMNSGDYTKLKDILNDNDEDIVSKLFEGIYTIDTAFKKLEQRRKKESAEEKANRRAEKVYDNAEESGIEQVAESGETGDEVGLSDEEIANLTINASELDDDINDASISEMVENDKNLPGYEPHKQKTGDREYIDPALRKAVMARDNSTCQCCKLGGPLYADSLDLHHIMPVFLSGADSIDNSIMLCVLCHRMVHLYSTNDLPIQPEIINDTKFEDLSEDNQRKYISEELFENEKRKVKRIIKLGSVIRKGVAQRGLNREQYKKEHSNAGIGRNLPGVGPNKQTKA